MKGKDKNIKFFWPTKKKIKKTLEVLISSGGKKIPDAIVTILNGTTNFQVRQPVRKQPV